MREPRNGDQKSHLFFLIGGGGTLHCNASKRLWRQNYNIAPGLSKQVWDLLTPSHRVLGIWGTWNLQNLAALLRWTQTARYVSSTLSWISLLGSASCLSHMLTRRNKCIGNCYPNPWDTARFFCKLYMYTSLPHCEKYLFLPHIWWEYLWIWIIFLCFYYISFLKSMILKWRQHYSTKKRMALITSSPNSIMGTASQCWAFCSDSGDETYPNPPVCMRTGPQRLSLCHSALRVASPGPCLPFQSSNSNEIFNTRRPQILFSLIASKSGPKTCLYTLDFSL